MQSTEWRPIPGYDGKYEASSDGQVRNARTGYVLKQAMSKRYPYVNLFGKTQKVHRLVALTFLGDPEPGQEVCHLNDVKSDNRVENLRWDTRAANVADAIRHGLHPAASRLAATHCPHGHEMTEENTYRYPSGGRSCRTCRTEAGKVNFQRKKARGYTTLDGRPRLSRAKGGA